DMTYLAESQAVKPIIIPQLGRRLRSADDLMAFFRVLRLLFKFRPQIVHTHTAKAGTLGRLAALLYNTVQSLRSTPLCFLQKISIVKIRNPQSAIQNPKSKVVHTFHGHVLRGYFSPFKSRLFQRIEKILAKFTDAIVVVSEQQKEELCRDFGIGRRQQYQVIPLGFDLTPFSRGAADMGQFPARLGPAENSGRLVGIIGRLTGIKNHRLFLEAVQLLTNSKEDNKTRFLIVGDGELRKDLESLTHTLHLEDRVIFTGWMKDLTPLYVDLDVLALTSDNEGTPVAMIEAMAAGVPVVATDVGGVRELISECGNVLKPPGAMRNAGDVLKPPGAMFSSRQALLTTKAGEFEVCERGILVKPGNVRGFAKGLQYLLERPHVCKQMGQRGREYAMQRHSKERLVADTDRLYRSLLE
ncbi:MAG: glycosyltransferase, partial [Deltaproteobacteria bacterium]|nr:glycosyltransferase [Deltaproteobacteria bacterium]